MLYNTDKLLAKALDMHDKLDARERLHLERWLNTFNAALAGAVGSRGRTLSEDVDIATSAADLVHGKLEVKP